MKYTYMVLIVLLSVNTISAFSLFDGSTNDKRRELIRSIKQIEKNRQSIAVSAQNHCSKALRGCLKKYKNITISTYTLKNNSYKKSGTTVLNKKLPFRVKSFDNNYIRIRMNQGRKIKYIKIKDLSAVSQAPACFKDAKSNCLN